MAKYAKQKPNSTRARIALIVILAVVALVGGGLVLMLTGGLDSIASVFAPVSTTATSSPVTSTTAVSTTVIPTTTETTTTTTALPPEFSVPEEMKGVWITPGVDYLTSKKDSVNTVKTQIQKAVTAIEDWQFNTVLLPMHLDDQALYPSRYLESRILTDDNGEIFDPLQYIATLAREKNLFVYGIVELHTRDTELWDPRIPEDTQRITTAVKEQALRYNFDGFFLSDFTFAGAQVPNGKEAEAEQALTTMISQAALAIREVNRNFYVGLLSTGVWAHKSVDARGSDTAEYYEEFTDGRADTLSWITEGLFDCVMVQNYASTNHPTASFQKVLSWWNGVAKTQQIPLYVSHSANTIGSYKVGWKLIDQLAQQYLYCKSAEAWQGSVYDSVTALRKDSTGIAETLKKAYAGTLNEEFIYKSLTITSPAKTSYSTVSSTVKFEGGGDTNFPLTINGEAVELTEHGFFTKTIPLSIGKNTFVFSHKGVTKTYTITYKPTLLESVSPNMNMEVDGGSPFIISAVARKSSVVKATLGAQTITLTAIPNKEDENGGEESDFETYSGSLVLPKGIVAKSQNLGAVTVVASNNGVSETLKGGTIVVDALPIPTTTTTTVTTTTTTATTTTTTTTIATTTTTEAVTTTITAAGVSTTAIEGVTTTGGTVPDPSATTLSGGSTIPTTAVSTLITTNNTTRLTTTAAPTTATTKATNPTVGGVPVPGDEGNRQIVVITSDYAETFTGGLADDFSRPYNSFLPKGTWDYLEGKVYNGNYSYYLLSSGKRVYMRQAKVVTAGELETQQLTNGAVHLTKTHTVFEFNTQWRVPIYASLAPQSYQKDVTSGTPHYGLEKYGQTAEYVDVTFHFVNEVPAAPDLSNNPLFSKAQWIKEEDASYTLRLTLRKKGGYYGFSPVWNGDGTLSLSFLNPVDISKNSGAEKLKGIRILIDPGHGSPTDKPWEAPFNMDYANTLKEKLESLGATVVMTRTGPLTTDLSLDARTAMAHNNEYHMFISVHMNGANGVATGATVWYYYEYSYSASKYIYDEMHKAETPYGVGTKKNGNPRASGTNWSTLYLNRTIHDCPSVLLECAFLDNPKDKECLIDPIYRDKLMQAVTDGVVNYFSSQK